MKKRIQKKRNNNNDNENDNDNEEKEIIYKSQDLPQILSDLAKAGEVADLKVEEVDFEDIIHRFLATESRPR